MKLFSQTPSLEASCRSKHWLQEALLAAASGFPHDSRCSFIGHVGVASGPRVLEEAAVLIFFRISFFLEAVFL